MSIIHFEKYQPKFFKPLRLVPLSRMRSLEEGRGERDGKKGKEKFAYRVSLREARFQRTFRVSASFEREGGCNHVTPALQDEATGFDIGLKLYSNSSFLPKDFHKNIKRGDW